MSSIISKIVSGGDQRSTRLHTEDGELINLAEACRDVPTVAFSKLTTLVTGRRPIKPWWPIRVIPIIDKFLKPHHDVVEFGSGSSTIWLAQRARSVAAMEEDAEWAQKTEERLIEVGLTNVTIWCAQNQEYWAGPPVSAMFDLAIVDGGWRWKCVETALLRMKPGGLLYLDNSDSDKDAKSYLDHSSSHLAQGLMHDYAAANPGAAIERVSSMIEGELFAGSGLILKTPRTERRSEMMCQYRKNSGQP